LNSNFLFINKLKEDEEKEEEANENVKLCIQENAPFYLISSQISIYIETKKN